MDNKEDDNGTQVERQWTGGQRTNTGEQTNNKEMDRSQADNKKWTRGQQIKARWTCKGEKKGKRIVDRRVTDNR